MILKSKLNRKNKVIKAGALAVFRHGAGINQWEAIELKDLDRKSRKTMTMYGELHPESDIDRLYVKRTEGGTSLISLEQCIGEENSLGFYVANLEENLIGGVLTAEAINTKETITSAEFKKQKAKELKGNWSEKQMHGQFIREMMEKVDKEKTWQWFSGIWSRSIVVCCIGAGNQDKLYEVPYQ